MFLVLSLPNPLKTDVKIENEDVIGAAPTGDAPTTSEWSTILLFSTVSYIKRLTVTHLASGIKDFQKIIFEV